MKTPLLIAALAALGTHAGLAAAQQAYGDVARVISATPIRDTVTESRRDCRVETVTGYQERREAPSGAGAVVGAIVGGVIGHQFGNSTAGRDHGTAAGAVVGGLIGNQVEKDNNTERAPLAREVERCRFVPETRERVVAWDVRYEYNGREFSARMGYDPGPEMPVNVEVRPPASTRPYAAGPGPLPPSYRQ